jgi:hypothetical protein
MSGATRAARRIRRAAPTAAHCRREALPAEPCARCSAGGNRSRSRGHRSLALASPVGKSVPGECRFRRKSQALPVAPRSCFSPLGRNHGPRALAHPSPFRQPAAPMAVPPRLSRGAPRIRPNAPSHILPGSQATPTQRPRHAFPRGTRLVRPTPTGDRPAPSPHPPAGPSGSHSLGHRHHALCRCRLLVSWESGIQPCRRSPAPAGMGPTPSRSPGFSGLRFGRGPSPLVGRRAGTRQGRRPGRRAALGAVPQAAGRLGRRRVAGCLAGRPRWPQGSPGPAAAQAFRQGHRPLARPPASRAGQGPARAVFAGLGNQRRGRAGALGRGQAPGSGVGSRDS